MHYLIAAVIAPHPDHAILVKPDPLWSDIEPEARTGYPSESVKTAIAELVEPFREEYQDERGQWHYRPEGKWDWYTFGGRYSGRRGEGWQGLTVAELLDKIGDESPAFGLVYPSESDERGAAWFDRDDIQTGYWFGPDAERLDAEWIEAFRAKLSALPGNGYVVFLDCHS